MSRKLDQRTVDQAYDIEGSRVRCEIARNQGAQDRLDAFLALTPAGRGSFWRSLTDEARRELVITQGMRAGKDVGDDWIAGSVDGLNARYGSEPTATEAATLGALETLEASTTRAIYHARTDIGRAMFQNEARAYRTARDLYLRGWRPTQIRAGHWSIPSETTPERYYTVKGGRCTCQAGRSGRMCKHAALVVGIERGIDFLEYYDSELASRMAA